MIVLFRGKPSTPRDGSAVELVGLSYSCLSWLAEANAAGLYSHRQLGEGGDSVTLEGWASRIKANFDLHYYVSRDSPVDDHKEHINKEGIYKDTLNSQMPWTDYQLR